MATTINLPAYLSEKLGVSHGTATRVCMEAIFSVEDTPRQIKHTSERLHFPVQDEDWGKKLTVKGTTNTYVVQLDKPEPDQDYFPRERS